MKRLAVTLTIVVFLALLPVMLTGQEKHMEKHVTCKGGALGLGLDEKQTEQMHEMKIQLQMEMIDLQAELKKLRLEVKRELMGDEPDQSAINKIIDKIGATRVKIQKARINHLFEAKKILTDEQFKKIRKQYMHRGGHRLMKRMRCTCGHGGRMIGRGNCRMHGHGGCRMHGHGGCRMHGHSGSRMHGLHGMHEDIEVDIDLEDEGI